MNRATDFPSWVWLWMFCVPLHVLLSLFGGGDRAAWEETDDDNILIVIDSSGHEHIFISDALARRNDPYALNIPWNTKNWAALDADLAPDHAWMPLPWAWTIG